jgi:methylmalonyl-CoA mutase N-terminal domain/subunit
VIVGVNEFTVEGEELEIPLLKIGEEAERGSASGWPRCARAATRRGGPHAGPLQDAARAART